MNGKFYNKNMFKENDDQQITNMTISEPKPAGDSMIVPINHNSHTWRNWSLVIVLVIVLVLGGWWYYNNRIQNTIPPVEDNNLIAKNNIINEEQVATTTPEDLETAETIASTLDGRPISQEDMDVSRQLQASLSQFLTPIILCLDGGIELNQLISGGILCDGQRYNWPNLPEGYTWGQDFSSNSQDMTWKFSAQSEKYLDITCSQAGCLLEEFEPIEIETVDDASEVIDSDNDGLMDDSELTLWHTDPSVPDTDGDGYLDGGEVKSGYNPLGQGSFISDNYQSPLDNGLISFTSPQNVFNAIADAINTNNAQAYKNYCLTNSDVGVDIDADDIEIEELQYKIDEIRSVLNGRLITLKAKRIGKIVNYKFGASYEIYAEFLNGDQIIGENDFFFTNTINGWKLGC